MHIHTILWTIFFQWQIVHCALLDERQAPSPSTHSAPDPLDPYGIFSSGVTVASGPAAASFTNDALALLSASGIPGTGVICSPSIQSQSLSAAASIPLPGGKVGAVATITAPPVALSTCQPGACYGEATSVTVFYWPPASSNTACLATISDPPAPTLFPPGLTPVSPSVYIILKSYVVTDGCNQIATLNTFTASFDPSQISTQSPANNPRLFNFADLPCGSSDSFPSDGKPFRPWFHPPPSIFDQMGFQAYANCTQFPWKDPNIALSPVESVNEPHLPTKPRFHRGRRVPEPILATTTPST